MTPSEAQKRSDATPEEEWLTRGMRLPNDNPSFELRPGRAKAIQYGCTCTPDQKPVKCRDGWGWDINKNCKLHAHWGELAE